MSLRASRRYLLLTAFALLWIPLRAQAFLYWASSIEGWVMDAETNKPLEDVVVVAHWQLKATSLAGGGPAIKELQIYEAVTDQNGRYYFPSWGPRFAFQGSLGSSSPELLFFKPGYKHVGLANEWYRGMDTTRSEWDKKTVKLERFAGTRVEYAKHLDSLNSSLWIVGFQVGHHSGDYCGWRSFPKMLRAIDSQYSEFRRVGINYSSIVSSLRAADSQVKSAGCGSIEDVITK